MTMASVLKGVAAVAAVGTAAYLVSATSPRTKRKMKKVAEKTMHGVGTAMNNISDMM